MLLLISGLLLWSFAHLIPALMPGFKKLLIEKATINGYKGLMTVSLIAAIVIMVFGWRSIEPVHLYYLGAWVQKTALLLIIIAIYLIVNFAENNRLNRFVRHPQLTGLILWAIAHVLINGDSRAVVLFTGLAIWGVVEIIAINHRDGGWEKPEVDSLAIEFKSLVKTLIVVAVLAWAHPYFAGVPVHA